MIPLWEKAIPGFNNQYPPEIPGIVPYLVETEKPNGCVIVCPGGGYEMKAGHEGEPIARWLNKAGLSAFVLNYRVAPYKHPYPMMDAKRAIRLVRYHAAKWNIDANKIGILGFSAGGHLVSTTITHFDMGTAEAVDPIDQMSSRPDAAVLCYPVISFGDYRHHGSMVNLLGEEPDSHLRYSLSSENSVRENTPPVFMWHTANDEAVPVENCLLFAQALSKKKVPFEVHIFPEGNHGLGLAEGSPIVTQWTGLCEKWLKNVFKL